MLYKCFVFGGFREQGGGRVSSTLTWGATTGHAPVSGGRPGHHQGGWGNPLVTADHGVRRIGS